MNINPINLTVQEWCDFMVDELLHLGQVPFLQDETEWQRWGQEICKLPQIAAYNPPNSAYFNNFYEWAERFNSTVPL